MRLVAETATADLKAVSLLRRTLRQALADLRLANSLINDVQLVFAELAVNTIRHGTPPPRTVGLQLDIIGVWLRLRITDDGGAFSDFDKRVGAIKLRDIAARHESGLGLQLALDLFDHLDYRAGSPNTMDAWRLLARHQPAVLLLEDDQSTLEIYGRALRPHTRLLTASSSKAAHDLLQQQSIDVVLASLETNAGEHWPVVEAIAGAPSHARPSLMLLTCDGANERSRSWAQLDDSRLLEKPVSLDQLRQALADLLRHKSASHTASVPSLQTRCSAVSYRHGAVETVVLSARPVDAQASIIVLDTTRDDRRRYVVAEGLSFGASGHAHCRVLANTIGSLTGNVDNPSPAVLLTQASDVLLATGASPDAERPVCAVTVLETTQDGHIEFAAASGRPIAILRPGGGRHGSLPVCDPAIGMRAGHSYGTVTTKLAADEQLVLVSESLHTTPPDRAAAVPPWIEQIVCANPRATAQELADRLSAEWPRASFTAAWDWCVVVVRIASQPASA